MVRAELPLDRFLVFAYEVKHAEQHPPYSAEECYESQEHEDSTYAGGSVLVVNNLLKAC